MKKYKKDAIVVLVIAFIMAVALTFVGSTLATLAEHAGQHVLPLPPYPPAPLPPAPAHRSCGC